MKKIILSVIFILIGNISFAQAVFSSATSGDWNNNSTWTLISGSSSDGIPHAGDDVTILNAHIVTLKQNESVQNITINNPATNVSLLTGAYTLNVNGTLNSDNASPQPDIINSATTVKFVGNMNRTLFGTLWGATTTGLSFEVALDNNIVGTASTSIKARNIVITSGTLNLGTNELRPDQGNANTGTLTINTNGILLCTRLSRTSTANTPFASLTINGAGKISFINTSNSPTPTVQSNFPVYTYSANAEIEYQGGTQTIADINYPNLTISAGTKTWTVGAAGRRVSGNINVTGSAMLILGGGTPITVSGNIIVSTTATIGLGSSGNRFIAEGTGRVFLLNGTARVVANETQTAGATNPFSYQYNSFTTYSFGANSWVSFRMPATGSKTQGIDGIVGTPYANVEIFQNQTTANTWTLKSNIEITGTLAFPSVSTGAITINFGSYIIKVGGGLQLNGSNTNTNTTSTRTYNTSTSTLELNGTSAQNTLGGSNLPSTFYNLVISNPSIVNITNAISTTNSFTINIGSTLATSSTITCNGTINVNGTFQINQGGWATGTNFVYGNNGTLVFNNSSGTYGINDNDVYWPVTNGPVNVTVLGAGGITLNGNRTINGLLQASAGITNGDKLTLNGTVKINTGGYFSASPSYGSALTLVYNSGGVYGRGTEWNGNSPANIQISNNTTLNYPNNSNPGAKSITGNLSIDAGSCFYMDYGAPTSLGELSIGGNIILNGNLSLGNVAGGDLNVAGNWTKGTTANFSPNSRMVQFNGSNAQSITGATEFDYLKINNNSGVTLNDNINVKQTLWMTNGKILTGANILTLVSTGSISGEAAGKYVVGNLQTTKSVGVGSTDLGGVGISLNAGTDDLGNVSVLRTSGSAGIVTFNGNSGLARRWHITSDNPPSAGRDLTLAWISDDDNGKDLTTAQLWKSTDNGSNWFTVGVMQDVSSTHSITVNTNSFSDWTISDGANPLPVELTSFASSVKNNSVILNWATATETSNYGFDVERSSDKVKWSKVAFINGNGNSNSEKHYSYVDKSSMAGKQYYRLKQIDTDGKYEYSKIVEVNLGLPKTYELSQNYPNPFNPVTTIRYAIPESQIAKVTIFNALGEVVAKIVDGYVEAGVHEVQFNAGNLASGIYFYRLEAGKYNQTKKMMLIK